jgi:hypothetical protein
MAIAVAVPTMGINPPNAAPNQPIERCHFTLCVRTKADCRRKNSSHPSGFGQQKNLYVVPRLRENQSMRKRKCRPRGIFGTPSTLHQDFERLLHFFHFRGTQEERQTGKLRQKSTSRIAEILRLNGSPDLTRLYALFCLAPSLTDFSLLTSPDTFSTHVASSISMVINSAPSRL